MDCGFPDNQIVFNSKLHRRAVNEDWIPSQAPERETPTVDRNPSGCERRTHCRKCLFKLGYCNWWSSTGLSLGPTFIFNLCKRLARRTCISVWVMCNVDVRASKNTTTHRELDNLQLQPDTWVMKFNAAQCKVMKMRYSGMRRELITSILIIYW